MDFINGYLKVKGMSSIMVVVDMFSKYVVFMVVPHAYSTKAAVDLLYKNVINHFRLSDDIVSDKDARFTGRFCTCMFCLLGCKLNFSTANHPQIDDQTERVNALLEEYLRHFDTTS